MVADEAYVRESILNPNAKIVKGYKRDIMPVFQGQLSEDSLLDLVVFVKSLSQQSGPETAAPQTQRTSK